MTKGELGFISDVDMYLFFEKKNIEGIFLIFLENTAKQAININLYG